MSTVTKALEVKEDLIKLLEKSIRHEDLVTELFNIDEVPQELYNRIHGSAYSIMYLIRKMSELKLWDMLDKLAEIQSEYVMDKISELLELDRRFLGGSSE